MTSWSTDPLFTTGLQIKMYTMAEEFPNPEDILFPLQELPDDVILYVMKNFLTASEIIKLEEISSNRFNHLINSFWIQTKKLSFQYTFKSNVFTDGGRSVVVVKDMNDDAFDQFTEGILKRCKNIQELYLCRSFDGSKLASLCPDLNNIITQDLNIMADYVTSIHDDDKTVQLKDMTFVRGMKTPFFRSCDLEFLRLCPKLRNLSLDLSIEDEMKIPVDVIQQLDGFKISNKSFLPILLDFGSKIKKMDLSRIKLNTSEVIDLVHKMPGLESLITTLSNDEDIILLANLKNLKDLSLPNNFYNKKNYKILEKFLCQMKLRSFYSKIIN